MSKNIPAHFIFSKLMFESKTNILSLKQEHYLNIEKYLFIY